MPETPVWIPPKHGPVPNPVMTGSGLRRYDISYALIPGFRPLELQLFVPESEQPTPLIVYIHGGGYAGGTRVEGTPWFEMTNYRQKALARGFAFASIDYRLGFEQSFAMTKAVGDAFIQAYLPIVQRRYQDPFTPEQKAFQEYRRGRYVEYNLLFDRGTIFGLHSGGRTESILMSMPPVVQWWYNYQPTPGTPEAKLYDYYLQPRDWLV